MPHACNICCNFSKVIWLAESCVFWLTDNAVLLLFLIKSLVMIGPAKILPCKTNVGPLVGVGFKGGGRPCRRLL
jgi:hypothetical protein